MITLPKLKTIAAAAGACVAMAVATPASAFVYAVSHLDITNLTLNFHDPNSVVNSFTFDLTNTATLNGVSSPTQTNHCSGTGFSNNCSAGPLPGVLNAAQAIAPGGNLVRGEDIYTFATTPEKLAPNTFSRADSIIRTAELVTKTPTSTEQIAESLLNTSGNAKANAEIQSHTNLTTTATFTGGVVDLNFLADPDQLAEIGGTSTGISAQSNMNATFTISLGVDKITFTPTGVGANSDCFVSAGFFAAGVRCTVSGDTESLNSNPSVGAAGTDSNSFGTADLPTAFGIHITGLAAAAYNIAFNTVTSVSIEAAVPEPGTTGLVGAALAGLAFTTVRRKRKQS